MKKINFIFGVHNHQPVGNFDNVFEWAVKTAYEPFLSVIEKHPKVKIVIHYTGCLIDWLEKNRPDIISRLKLLVKKGQAEMLTGGYHEPILPVISDIDKNGQIKKLTDYIKKEFLCTPKGLWLAERVWEPTLAKILNEAGVEYIVLDDAHFLASGIDEKKLRGYFITEDQGVPLKIFPICQKLRYTMPFAQPEDTINYLKSEASDDPSTLLVMADDGEKFGIWPETYKTCYEEKWLEKFLVLLEQNSDWINITTFSEYIKKYPAVDRIYLMATSYFEMSEWSLPAKTQVDFEEAIINSDDNLKRFLKGGFWRNFLTKYSESNNMHKKMLYISEKIKELKNDTAAQSLKESGSDDPVNLLYKGQCNCAYWHGIFGGLYLPHLRHAIYKNLIEAENSIPPSTEICDFDKDGQKEIIATTKNINVYLKPSYGGAITELDFKPVSFNLTDVLTRRFEAYHRKVDSATIKIEGKKLETIHNAYYTKELGLQKYLKYDWYNRCSLLDHFFHKATTLEKYNDCEYGEIGDFVNQPYNIESKSRKTKTKDISLKRDGHLWLESGLIPIQVLKTINIKETAVNIDYEITNNHEKAMELWYGCEFNLALSNPNDEKCFYLAGERKENFSAKTSFEKMKSLIISDIYGGFNLKMEASDLFDFWVFPIWTISLSEAGFEKTYQGSSVTVNKKFLLEPKGKYKFTLKMDMEQI
ncbi:MAG: DUF1926 domain-containing protein [Elusimicrobia bacterium]|nr:DUF1926 domain-containing protein [Elusimicrobiota bacterium]